jgi:hypothetical protein
MAKLACSETATYVAHQSIQVSTYNLLVRGAEQLFFMWFCIRIPREIVFNLSVVYNHLKRFKLKRCALLMRKIRKWQNIIHIFLKITAKICNPYR